MIERLKGDVAAVLAPRDKFESYARFSYPSFLPTSGLQLHEQQRLRAAFVDFEEGPITFPPTYKYDPGTNDFDSR